MSNKKILVIETPSNNSESPVSLSPIVKSSTSVVTPSLPTVNENMEEKTNELKKLFEEVDCEDQNYYSKGCNSFLLKKELLENQYLGDNPDEYDYLYPSLNDPNFIVKIAEKRNLMIHNMMVSFIRM